MAAILYATLEDLKLALQGSDAGSGTAVALQDNQLTDALTAASNRVSVYAGGIYDGLTAATTPPAIFFDLTLDLAVYFATAMYLKQKAMGQDHPARQRYVSAMAVLQDARDGKVRLDVATAGDIQSETGLIINRVPRVFTGNDSNTRVNPITGELEASTPSTIYNRHLWDNFGGGAEYQG